MYIINRMKFLQLNTMLEPLKNIGKKYNITDDDNDEENISYTQLIILLLLIVVLYITFSFFFLV